MLMMHGVGVQMTLTFKNNMIIYIALLEEGLGYKVYHGHGEKKILVAMLLWFTTKEEIM
jgi:hypothetical protein